MIVSFLAAAVLSRGAVTPWFTVQAESMATSGQVVSDQSEGSPAREASGGRCVQLGYEGSLDFVTPAIQGYGDSTGLVLRYSLQDTNDGGDGDGGDGDGGDGDGGDGDEKLPVYVNGKRVSAFELTNRFSHQFGKYPFTKNSSDGAQRHFWDESAIATNGLHPGDRVSLRWAGRQKLLVDLVDVEAIPPPAPIPPHAIKITDYGVTPNQATDATLAFKRAIAGASQSGRPLYIPAGTYHLSGVIPLDHVRVFGAGIWHTFLVADFGPKAERITLLGDGDEITVQDLSLRGNVTYRNDLEPNDGVSGRFGHGSVLKNLWIEHSKVGFWLTNSVGLKVVNCRVRDTIADGINLCLGMQDTEVENCSARGTGDDCFAMWPGTYAPSKFEHSGNMFRNCTAEVPYLAQGFAIYGGRDESVIGCCARNIPYGAGFYVSTTFPTIEGFKGVQLFRSNLCVGSNYPNAAVVLFADRHDLPNIHVEDLLARDPVGSIVRFSSNQGGKVVDAVFSHVRAQTRHGDELAPSYTATAGCAGNVRVGTPKYANLLPMLVVADPSQFHVTTFAE